MYKFDGIEISPVLESYLFDLRLAQGAKDRAKYYDRALESITAGSGEMLQKLYAEVLSKNTYDYSLIAESKGDLSRYKGYENIYKCIEYLNVLFEKAGATKACKELAYMNRIHDILLSLRGDFVFGYKTNVQVIKIIYENMTLSLHQLTNVCIIMYMNYLKDTNKKSLLEFNSGARDLIVVNSAGHFIKLYESGEWTSIMREFKKDPKSFFGSIVTNTIGAGIGVATIGGFKLAGQATGFKTAVNQIPSAVKSALKDPAFKTALKNLPGPSWIAPLAKYSMILAGMVLTIRGCVYVYNKLPIKIKDFAKTEAEFIKVNTEGELSNTESRVVEALERVAGTSETQIIKANAEAANEMDKASASIHKISSEEPVELF